MRGIRSMMSMQDTHHLSSDEYQVFYICSIDIFVIWSWSVIQALGVLQWLCMANIPESPHCWWRGIFIIIVCELRSTCVLSSRSGLSGTRRGHLGRYCFFLLAFFCSFESISLHSFVICLQNRNFGSLALAFNSVSAYFLLHGAVEVNLDNVRLFKVLLTSLPNNSMVSLPTLPMPRKFLCLTQPATAVCTAWVIIFEMCLLSYCSSCKGFRMWEGLAYAPLSPFIIKILNSWISLGWC